MGAGSLTRAAAELRTSQPTLSRELSAFEDELGFALFERRSKRLFATEQALQLYAAVQKSYQGIQQIAEVAQAILDNETSHISIACLPLFAETLLPRVCRRLIDDGAEGRVTFHAIDNAEMMRDLLALRYDLGVAEVGVAVRGMEVLERRIGQEVCILPAGHKLASLHVIRPADLTGEPFIGLPPSDPYRRRFDAVLSQAQLSNSTRIEANTAEAVCALVAQGVGIGFVNPISAWAWQGRGIHVREFSVSIPFVAGICRPIGRPKNRILEHVTRLVLEECEYFAQLVSEDLLIPPHGNA